MVCLLISSQHINMDVDSQSATTRHFASICHILCYAVIIPFWICGSKRLLSFFLHSPPPPPSPPPSRCGLSGFSIPGRWKQTNWIEVNRLVFLISFQRRRKITVCVNRQWCVRCCFIQPPSTSLSCHCAFFCISADELAFFNSFGIVYSLLVFFFVPFFSVLFFFYLHFLFCFNSLLFFFFVFNLTEFWCCFVFSFIIAAL